METEIVWLVSSHYYTPSNKEVTIEATRHVSCLLENRFWERPFSYAIAPVLRAIQQAKAVCASVYIGAMPPSESPCVLGIDGVKKILAKHCPSAVDTQQAIRDSGLDRSMGITVIAIKLEFGESEDDPQDPPELALGLQQDRMLYSSLGLAEEVGALLRGAILLNCAGGAWIGPEASHMSQGGSLVFFKGPLETRLFPRPAAQFTFPAHIKDDQLPKVLETLDGLSRSWHLPLWPVHRYLKALNAGRLEMENLIDLIFALEGLFDKNTDSRFIRTASWLLLSKNRNEACRIDSILKTAYEMRNEIVHGAKYYTGFDSINLGGGPTSPHAFFREVQSVVARMISTALLKLQRNPQMQNLRLTTQDLIEHIHP